MHTFEPAFGGHYIERCSEIRSDPAALAAAWADPARLVLAVHDARCPVGEAGLELWEAGRVAGTEPPDAIFLGRHKGAPLFALPLREPPAVTTAFLSLRDVLDRLPASDAALIAFARAMVGWQERHRHCGICGSRNRPVDGGFVMSCTSESCSHRTFPRLDPAVIVLVHRGDSCLLGRRPDWPDGRFSTLAGFVEPGESLEDAVRREVREETDVRVGSLTYVASQPWPFPASLMIGFHGEAQSESIRLNDGELVEACWIRRSQIAAGEVRLPPRQSVAFHLVAQWFDAGWPVPLARLPEVGIFEPPAATRSLGR